MIHAIQIPLNDADAATLHAWLNSPGRLIYQQFLASQSAEKMAEAGAIRLANEQGANDEAVLLEAQARVFTASKKFLDEVIAKGYKFYTVELKPETVTH